MEKAFSEEAKDFGDQIVSDIKVQFIKKLREAEWMSQKVRDLGIEKGEFYAPRLSIGLPPLFVILTPPPLVRTRGVVPGYCT